MTTFIIIAVTMVLISFALIVPPLLGRGRASGAVRDELNVAIFKERLSELELDLENEILNQSQYDQTKAELERALLQDVSSIQESKSGAPDDHGPWGALAAIVAVPILAVVFYLNYGATDFVEYADQMVQQSQNQVEQQHRVDNMVERLVARLEQEPDDAQGWYMLARTYAATKRYADAIPAFEKAHKMVGDDVELLVGYAESLAMVGGGDMVGRPFEMLKRALALNPDHDKGLWMAGAASFQAGKYADAIGYWERLEPRFPSDSQEGQMIRDYLSQARESLQSLGGVAERAAPQQAVAKGTSIQVSVALSDELAAKVQPDDVVFILAQAANGPRMPLAVVRKQAKDLPTQVVLDDSMAMVATMNLSAFPEVVVLARVSKSGQATPQSGDLLGRVEGVRTAEGKSVQIMIDQLVP